MTLVTETEAFRLDAVERFIKASLSVKKMKGFEPKNFNLKAIALDIRRRIKAKKSYRKLKQLELDKKWGKKSASAGKKESAQRKGKFPSGKKEVENERQSRRGSGRIADPFAKYKKGSQQSSSKKGGAPSSDAGKGKRSPTSRFDSKGRPFRNSKTQAKKTPFSKAKAKSGRKKIG